MTNLKELREKDSKELGKLLSQARQDLAQLKTERALGKLADGSQLPRKRNEVARILTVFGEKAVLAQLEENKNAEKSS